MNLPISPRSLRGGTDEELAALVQEGNEQAMAVLVSRMLSDVTYQASRINSSSVERDDLVQEGMLGLISAARRYKPNENATFRTFANVCIRNRMQSALRSGNDKKVYVSLDETLLIRDPSKTPEEKFDDEEDLSRIKILIRERLSKLESDVMTLWLEGDSYEEISNKLNISQKSVDNALQRIRKKLKTD